MWGRVKYSIVSTSQQQVDSVINFVLFLTGERLWISAKFKKNGNKWSQTFIRNLSINDNNPTSSYFQQTNTILHHLLLTGHLVGFANTIEIHQLSAYLIKEWLTDDHELMMLDILRKPVCELHYVHFRQFLTVKSRYRQKNLLVNNNIFQSNDCNEWREYYLSCASESPYRDWI